MIIDDDDDFDNSGEEKNMNGKMMMESKMSELINDNY